MLYKTEALFRNALNSSILQPIVINPTEGIIEGYPIVFNKRTNIGGYFYEEIDPDALRDADLSDIALFLNHNDNMLPLARHRRGKRGTMEINVDEKGLHIRAQLDVDNNTEAKRLCSAVQRGDIEGLQPVKRSGKQASKTTQRTAETACLNCG
jgi:HK97 family phage prohead protease